jgi:hypothetical protein
VPEMDGELVIQFEDVVAGPPEIVTMRPLR